jgi:uncharacterized protein YjbI with pentapeptide repeats
VVPAAIEGHITDAINATLDLPIEISTEGDAWLQSTPVPVPGSDQPTSSTVPSAMVMQLVTGPLQRAVIAVQNDMSLQGQQWNINYGVTTAPYNGSSNNGLAEVSVLNRDLLTAGADTWTAANISAMNGLSVDAGSVTYTPPATGTVWTATGVWSVNDEASLTTDIVTSLQAGHVYFQVTTPDYPNGLLRGQLVAGTTDPDTGLTAYSAVLSGASVIPAVTTTAQGTANFTLNSGNTGLTYSVNITGISESSADGGFYVGDTNTNATDPSRLVTITDVSGYGSLTLQVTNNWLRHLSACVQYLDVAGNVLTPQGWDNKIPDFLRKTFEPDSNKPFVALIPPVTTVFGVPVPASPTTISVPIWDEVHTVRLLMGGLGQGSYDSAVCPIGITVTALTELVLPVFLLAAGTAVTNSKAVVSLLADTEVLFAVCSAGVFLVAGPAAAYIALSQNPGGAATGLVEKFAPMLLSPVTSLGKWVAGKLVEGASERAAPFIDIALAVINGAVTVAELAQTVIEVLDSPFVFESDITRSMDLQVQLLPDPRFNKFPDYHNTMMVSVVYDVGTTLPSYGTTLPLTTLSDPITVTFNSVPAGGNLRVFAFFYAGNGWQSGQGSTGWIPATANDGSTLSIEGLVITTNEIPLNSSSVYVHQEKIGLVDGQLNWIAAVASPPTATLKTPSPYEGKGQSILRLGGITIAQEPEMIGYTWQATGLDLPPDAASTPPSDDALWTVQNLSVLQHPQDGYASPAVGFTEQPGIAYNMASVDNSSTNFYIDSSNSGYDVTNNPSGGYHVRSVSLAHAGPAPTFNTVSNQSFGRFTDPLDKYVYHPQGYIMGISLTANKLYKLVLATAAVADTDAPMAVLSSGEGKRDGLISGPVGLAIALDGRVLILESGNNRVQAFDTTGNPVKYFADPAGGSDKLSTLSLYSRVKSTYLDISVESAGYIYVLSYTGDGSDATTYYVDLYQPDGTFLVTTPNVAAAKIVVDILRNLYTLNFETIVDANNRVQPSVSMWLPPPPNPGSTIAAAEKIENVGSEQGNTFLGQWSFSGTNFTWKFPSENGESPFLNVYQIPGNNWGAPNCVVQVAYPPAGAAGPADLYYGGTVPYSGNFYLITGMDNVFEDAVIMNANIGENPPILSCYNQTSGLFGWWVDAQYGTFFGWSDSAINPASYPYTTSVNTPGAAYLRRFMNGAANPGANYSFIDISGEDYSGLTLPQAIFANADLNNTNFSNSSLNGANFKGCFNIKGVNFQNAKLSGAIFDGLDLTGFNFSGTDLSGASFKGTTLTNAVFDNADLSNADLSVAISVKGCSFKNATLFCTSFSAQLLTGVVFTGAQMTGTVFSNTDLTVATFSSPPAFSVTSENLTDLSGSTLNYGLINLQWSYLNLSNATIKNLPVDKNFPADVDLSYLIAQSTVLDGLAFSNTNFASSNFTNADLRGASFAGCGMANSCFKGAQLQGDDNYRATNMSSTNLENADFSDANLTGALFSGAFLWGSKAKLAGATIIRTVFDQAYLVGVDFSGVSQNECQGANFDYACLLNTIFKGTNAGEYQGQPTSFSNACLQGADFSNANLSGANLNNAIIAQQPGEFPVTFSIGWPMEPISHTITFAVATLGIENATDDTTTCPDTENGPCSVTKQAAINPATAWPLNGAQQGVHD